MTKVRRYILKNYFCFSILNSCNQIPVGVGVDNVFAVGSTVACVVFLTVGCVFVRGYCD